MMGVIKYLLIPSFAALVTPILLAVAGLVDYGDAGAWSFYIMIFVVILNVTLYKKVERMSKTNKQPMAS